MPAAEAFVDTNILVYLLSADAAKADRAETLVGAGALISVQVLNELTNVARRKLSMSWQEIGELTHAIRSSCQVAPLTLETHDMGRELAQRYSLSVYDAMIVASALLGECRTLYSEDMQHGLLIDRQLRVRNPFST
jgi:predicted nucleic acid-binding protein